MRKGGSTFSRYNSSKHSVAPHRQSSHSVKKRIEEKFADMPASEKSSNCPQCKHAVWKKAVREAKASGATTPPKPAGAAKTGHVEGCDKSFQAEHGVKERKRKAKGAEYPSADGGGGGSGAAESAGALERHGTAPFGVSKPPIPNSQKQTASIFTSMRRSSSSCESTAKSASGESAAPSTSIRAKGAHAHEHRLYVLRPRSECPTVSFYISTGF